MIFTYHEILPDASRYLYRVSTAQFREHVALFAAENGRVGGAPGITFDDGHRSNFEQAYPVLEHARLQATFFVLAGCVGKSADYMTWTQVREMAEAGHSMQSHGWSHRMLTLCEPQELQEELAGSKKELEDRLGKPVTSLSIPGGRWNDHVAAAAARAGYKFIFHSNPWASTRALEGAQLQGRLMLTNTDDANALKRKMEISGTQRAYLQMKYNAKEGVRSALGERLYHKLWCKLANWNPEDGMEVQVDGPVRATDGGATTQGRL